jgi:cytochrome c-type biogenesis protein CcmH
MTGFLIAAAVAVAVVLVLLLRPFIWSRPASRMSQRQMNAAVYRDQLAKLDQDLAEGALSTEDHARSRDELQRRALEDLREDDAAPTLRAPRRTMLAVGITVPLVAVVLYAFLGNVDALIGGGGAAGEPKVTQADVERMVAGLATKLEQNPTDYKGWTMLARSYKVMGRTADAEKAFERAAPLVDTDPQLLADYADVVVTNNNGSFAGKPQQLIDKALKLDPNAPMALWLGGTAAFSKGDKEQAIRLWERLAKQIPPDSEDGRNLQAALDEVRGKAPASAQASAAQAAPAATPVVAAAANGSASVTGTVELDAALKGKASAKDTIMVIARAPGMRMPLAVLRVPATQFPLKFTLDDSLSMSPQAKLSGASEVEVEARVSKSGQAVPEPGDLFSPVQTVKVGAKDVTLKVAQVRP